MSRHPVAILIAGILLASPVLPISSPPVIARASQAQQALQGKKDPGPVQPAYIKLPATKTVDISIRNLFYLKPDTNCTSVEWKIPSGLVQDSEIALKDKNAVALYCTDKPPKSTYSVFVFGSLNDKLASADCIVTIQNAPPTPPPTPPTPPTPPIDPLTQSLQAAYSQDTDAQKASYIKTLGTLYETAATSTVNDATITTLGQLFQTMTTASGNLLPATAVPKTRAAIAIYLSGQLGTNAAQALDPTTRAKCVTAFTAVSTSLGNVK